MQQLIVIMQQLIVIMQQEFADYLLFIFASNFHMTSVVVDRDAGLTRTLNEFKSKFLFYERRAGQSC